MAFGVFKKSVQGQAVKKKEGIWNNVQDTASLENTGHLQPGEGATFVWKSGGEEETFIDL